MYFDVHDSGTFENEDGSLTITKGEGDLYRLLFIMNEEVASRHQANDDYLFVFENDDPAQRFTIGGTYFTDSIEEGLHPLLRAKRFIYKKVTVETKHGDYHFDILEVRTP